MSVWRIILAILAWAGLIVLPALLINGVFASPNYLELYALAAGWVLLFVLALCLSAPGSPR